MSTNPLFGVRPKAIVGDIALDSLEKNIVLEKNLIFQKQLHHKKLDRNIAKALGLYESGKEFDEDLARALSLYSMQEKQVLQFRLLGEPKSLQEIAEKLELTRERVRIIVSRAQQKMEIDAVFHAFLQKWS